MAAPRNIADYRAAARRRLPRGLFDFLDRGSEDDVANADNLAAFRALKLRPRILAGAAPRSLATRLLGRDWAMPVGIAPVGIAGQVWHRGEIALARAAERAGVPFVLSGATTVPLEEVARSTAADTWFQLYVSGDRARSSALVDRVRDAGYAALVLTADSLVGYNREFAARSGFDIPFRLRRAALDIALHPRWLFGSMLPHLRRGRLPGPVDYPLAPPAKGEKPFALKDDSLDWDFLDGLRARWPKALIVKGVLDPRDAARCVEAGADAVIVSNHGGISLDASVAPIDALGDIVAAVGGRVPVLLDGGVRRGSDVLKAIARGADFVLLGRAAIYALAARGEEGVVHALGLLAAEMDRGLAQLGCRSPADLTPEHLAETPVRVAAAPRLVVPA